MRETTGGTAAWLGGTASSTNPAAPTHSEPAEPVPGIETALPDHVPPNAFLCFPEATGIGLGTVAQVSDPAAPRITVAVPDGWTSELTGAFLGPAGAVDFADRITHIWTNTDKYLVAVHVEGPADAPGFGAAKTALMQDFAVVIP